MLTERPRFAVFPFTALTAAGAVACGDGSGAHLNERGLESWWIPPVEMSLPAEWTLLSEPEIELPQTGQDEVFLHRPTSVSWLPDGSYLVADEGNMRVLIFDRGGDLKRSLGRVGFGPDEIRSLRGAVAFGPDTLLLFDPVGRKISMFTSHGEFMRSVPVSDHHEMTLPWEAYELRGVTGRGEAVLVPGSVTVWPRAAPEAFHVSAPVLVQDLGGQPTQALDLWRSVEMWGDAVTSIQRPFGATTSVTVRDRWVYVAENWTGRVQGWLDGRRLERTLRVGSPVRPVTRRLAQSWREAWAGRIDDGPERRTALRWLERIDFPEQLPYFDEVAVSATGDLWIRSVSLPGLDGPVRWTVLDPKGAPVARLEAPPELRMAEIHQDRILGIWTDSMGVQSVRVYSLLRTASSPE